MGVSYPTGIWDGDSDTRDSDDAPQKAPNWRDWNRLINELAAVQTKLGLGAPSGDVVSASGISAVQDYSGVQKVVITLSSVAITIAEGSVKEYGSLKLFDFDVGAILMVGSTVNLAVTTETMSETADGDYSLGSAVATDADLSSLQVDMHDKTTIAQLSGGDGVIDGSNGAGAAIIAAGGSASDLYLNIIFDQGGGAGTATVTGTITLFFINLGDY